MNEEQDYSNEEVSIEEGVRPASTGSSFRGTRSRRYEVYPPRPSRPDWNKQEIGGPTRRYIVRPKRYRFDAEWIVDDKDHTVYVHVSRY